MGTKNILPDYWEYIENNRHKKLYERIWKQLNKDRLNSIQLDDNVFWIETMAFTSPMPNYVYEHIKKWGRKQGYKYIYD